VCENNQFATEIAFSYATRNTDVWKRAESYGIPGVCVDGNDVLAVHEAAGEAITRARAGGGPTLIECKTYRTRAHAEGMRDAGYRTADEVDAWKARDPIRQLASRVLSAGLATQAELDAIAQDVRAIVEDAAEFAKNSPFPEGASATQYVYEEA
jgi:2-oxoisovalerate dehydrogenase E1 component